MHHVLGFEVDRLGRGVVDAHGPQGVDLLGGGLLRLAREDQVLAVGREDEDAPVQVAGVDDQAAVGGGRVHRPGVAARQVDQVAGDVERREGGLRADHDDLGRGLLQDDGLDHRAADLDAVLGRAADGDLLLAVDARLHQTRFALGQGLVADGLPLEGQHLDLGLEVLAHARQFDLVAVAEYGVVGWVDAVEIARGDARLLQRLDDGAARLHLHLEGLAVGQDGDADLAAELRGTAANRQEDGGQENGQQAEGAGHVLRYNPAAIWSAR